MPLTSDTDIARVLHTVKTIALLGASHKPVRPSYGVMAFLLAQGYTVIPVNPGHGGSEIQGQKVYASLDDIPVAVDMVDVFRQSRFLPEIFEQAISLGIKTVWTQLDVVDEEAAALAEKQGVRVVMDRCPVIEWPRVMG